MKMKTIAFFALLALLLPTGCMTPDVGRRTEPRSPTLARAEMLLDQGRHTAALIECVELARRDPLMPGLPELQAQIMAALTEERAQAAVLRSSMTARRLAVDAEQQKTVPDTYRLRRQVRGLTGPLRTTPSAMQQVLDRKVTVHLDGVTLSDFILAIGASENVNIIADDALSADENPPTLTLHAEDVPLSEILEYVSRNLGVKLYVGENILWVTPGTPGEPGTPMETRMYRLRKGLSSEELETGDGRIKIIEAIERFVPQEAGADRLFDRKSHVLIVRDIPRNLASIEDLIEALDVVPPQVLIEARFISAGATNLRELGIDWILNSPVAVTRRGALRNNQRVWDTHTQIDATEPDAIIGFAPFPQQAQGLNFSFQGILTDPMFRAVVHALETSGKAQTLSVPKVTTVNNRAATMRIGEDFRYFQEYDIQSVPSSVTDAGSQVYSSILVPVGMPQLEELGIQLDVTPSVGADLNSITLNILPEISEFVRYEHYEVGTRTGTGGNNVSTNGNTGLVRLPIFRRSRIETELIVQSGETVVMGGLVTSSENRIERGVPILSSIPLIGRLFRHDELEIAQQNLLIFVTATIISERGETLIPVSDDSFD